MPEVNDSQDERMGHILLVVIWPWSKLVIQAVEQAKIRSPYGFLEFFLLFQKDYKEQFGIRGQFFNFSILVLRLFCGREELLSRCFQENLHGYTGDVVAPFERLPI